MNTSQFQISCPKIVSILNTFETSPGCISVERLSVDAVKGSIAYLNTLVDKVSAGAYRSISTIGL